MPDAIERGAVTLLSISFSGVIYACRKCPVDRGREAEPVNVTTLSDTEEHFLPGPLLKNGDIAVTITGAATPPVLNTVGPLIISFSINNGTAVTAKSVTIANAILTKREPPSVDAGGDRAMSWDLTFRPDGTTAQAEATA